LTRFGYSASISFNQTTTNAIPWLKIVTWTALRWSKEGWGGHINVSLASAVLFCLILNYSHQANNLINVNSKLSLTEAKASLKNISDYALSQNGTVIIETLPSWKTFFDKYVINAESVSHSLLANHTSRR
jgi:hypothetical protein